MRRIAVLDAPSNLGLRPPTATSVPGCAKAPGALRDQGLLARLGARDAGCLTPPRYDPGDWRPGDGVAHAAEISAYSRALADRIGAIIDGGEFPVVLGGDCSILIGSGIAMHRLGDAVGGRIGLVFVDGHSDFRHPGNASYVGAAAGEDLALVTGRGQADLAAIESRRPYFRDIDVVVLGIRAQDEYRLDLQAAGIVTRPVPALRAEGAARSAQWARDQLVDCAGYWVHVDVDVLDPAVMPAVDAPDPGGIAFPELELLLSGLVESPHCLGVEITVFDPDYDPDGRYAAEITSAVVSGLSPVRTTTPRPDLIAARRDLASTPAPTIPPLSMPASAVPFTVGPDAASLVPEADEASPASAAGPDADSHVAGAATADATASVPEGAVVASTSEPEATPAASVESSSSGASVTSAGPAASDEPSHPAADTPMTGGVGAAAFLAPGSGDALTDGGGSLPAAGSDATSSAADPDTGSTATETPGDQTTEEPLATGDSDEQPGVDSFAGPPAAGDDRAQASPESTDFQPGFMSGITPLPNATDVDLTKPAGTSAAEASGPAGSLPSDAEFVLAAALGDTAASDGLRRSDGLHLSDGLRVSDSLRLSDRLKAGDGSADHALTADLDGSDADGSAGNGASADSDVSAERDLSAERDESAKRDVAASGEVSTYDEVSADTGLPTDTESLADTSLPTDTESLADTSLPTHTESLADTNSLADTSALADISLSTDSDAAAEHEESVGREEPKSQDEHTADDEEEATNQDGFAGRTAQEEPAGPDGEEPAGELADPERSADAGGHLAAVSAADQEEAARSADDWDEPDSVDDDQLGVDSHSDGQLGDGIRGDDELGVDSHSDGQLGDGIHDDDELGDGTHGDDELGADSHGDDESDRRADVVAAADGAVEPLREYGDTAIRLLSRPLGSAPLLDSEPLPATRPGMLRPRPPADPPTSGGVGSPAAGTGRISGFPPGAA
ncbi:hypothetical protein Ait01nite_005110 [Actinoplanes italicus]|nr:hypothetical protein Ait01nite_005110 [Actinoplanes italicus]